MATLDEIYSAVAALRTKTEIDSVTPADIAAIFEMIRSAVGGNVALINDLEKELSDQLKSAMADSVNIWNKLNLLVSNMVTLVDGRIPLDSLSNRVLYQGDLSLKSKLPSDVMYTGSEVLQSQILPLLFERALFACHELYASGSYGYAPVDYKESASMTSPIRKNGYYPSENSATPYYAFGVWLRANQVWAMLFDRYTPFGGGMLAQSPVNLPVRVKPSDTRLSMAYACCLNHIPQVLVLSPFGWAGSVSPSSIYRAFNGAGNLQAVIGEISLDMLASASEAANAFVGCSKLWQFHLANISDCVTTLDLSDVSDDMVANHTYSDTQSAISKKQISSFEYLIANYNRDGKRTKILQIKVKPSVMPEAFDIYDRYEKAGKADHIELVES